MLHLLTFIKHARLPNQSFPKSLNNLHFRYMCDKCDKPPSDDVCPNKVKEKDPDCESTPKEKTKCKTEEPKPIKDETIIAGGNKCSSKKKARNQKPESAESNKSKKISCEELILKREGLENPKEGSLAKVRGGGLRCPCKPCPIPPPSYKHSNMWKKISLVGALPLVAILTLLTFTSHHEGERPEFKKYPFMYQRTKPFCWGDGNHSRFHNSYWNALPPDGYEDEIDVEAVGKTPETDKERDERLKEFVAKQKEWKKVTSQREAEAKKAQAAAEKEAKRLQAEAEKEAKRLQAEAEKEAKRLQAEAEKEAKRQQADAEKEAKRQQAEVKKQQAEAAKEEKRQRAEAEKERKRQETEDKKQAKNDTKKVLHSFLTEEPED